MSFIEMIDEGSARGDLAELYDRIAGARGGVADVMKVHSLNPAAMAAHFEFYKTLMFGRSELDRRTREMIGVIVSATNECIYCVDHHSEPLRAYRVPEPILDELAAGKVPDAYVSEPIGALLSYARDLTRAPAADPAAVEGLRQLGWSDAAILDATLITGYFNFVNRVVLGLGVEIERDFQDTCSPEIVA